MYLHVSEHLLLRRPFVQHVLSLPWIVGERNHNRRDYIRCHIQVPVPGVLNLGNSDIFFNLFVIYDTQINYSYKFLFPGVLDQILYLQRIIWHGVFLQVSQQIV